MYFRTDNKYYIWGDDFFLKGIYDPNTANMASEKIEGGQEALYKEVYKNFGFLVEAIATIGVCLWGILEKKIVCQNIRAIGQKGWGRTKCKGAQMISPVHFVRPIASSKNIQTRQPLKFQRLPRFLPTLFVLLLQIFNDHSEFINYFCPVAPLCPIDQQEQSTFAKLPAAIL